MPPTPKSSKRAGQREQSTPEGKKPCAITRTEVMCLKALAIPRARKASPRQAGGAFHFLLSPRLTTWHHSCHVTFGIARRLRRLRIGEPMYKIEYLGSFEWFTEADALRILVRDYRWTHASAVAVLRTMRQDHRSYRAA